MTMFAGKTMLERATRGVIGFSAFAAAILRGRNTDVASVLGSVALAILALIALRGCPVCWTIGMVETLYRRTFHMFKTRP